MKEVTMREFTRNPYAFVNELPIVVTKNGEPFMKVVEVPEEEKQQVRGLSKSLRQAK